MGVKLIGGSDAGWSNGQIWGLSGRGSWQCIMWDSLPMQAVLAGTRDAAAAMGILDSVGTIEAGKEADLLLVDGNPAEDITDLRRVAAVFLAGQRVDGSGLRPRMTGRRLL